MGFNSGFKGLIKHVQKEMSKKLPVEKYIQKTSSHIAEDTSQVDTVETTTCCADWIQLTLAGVQ